MSSTTKNLLLRPQLRILCLHDAESNAAALQASLKPLGDRLYTEHGQIDLVYVNSPLAVAQTDEENASDTPSRRVWWHDALHKENIEQPSYIGLDASLLMLQQVWTSCPFWGILGVGQGATVAAMLALLPSTTPPPQFCILMSGSSLLPERERLSDIPCLHLRHDTEADDSLVIQFGGEVHQRSDRHRLTKADWNILGRYIIGRRQALRESASGQVVALQMALHRAETAAAEVLAERIAENPPAALMAVIRPQAVAGWSGNRRRQFGEEGGGAPCPSEFLLHKEKRSGTGASRMHPKAEEGG